MGGLRRPVSSCLPATVGSRPGLVGAAARSKVAVGVPCQRPGREAGCWKRTVGGSASCACAGKCRPAR
eukprot:1284743-Lingulodinium_polyedra.AAC.1